MVKTTHGSGSSHTTGNKNRPKRWQKLNLHERINWSVQFEELVQMINPTVSILKSNDHEDKTLKEKLENSKKVIFR